MKQTVLITTAAVAILASAGAWLYATERLTPNREPIPGVAQIKVATPLRATTTTQSAGAPTAQADAPPPASLPASHTIDWVNLTPPTIAAGASTSVVITAEISDPAVIRSSVNLIYTPSGGSPSIIGALNDQGLSGDLKPGDNVFTFVGSFSSYPAGAIVLRISVAFAGSLIRTQTSPFQLNILPAISTAGWVTLGDSQHLFSISVPGAWGLSTVESPGDNADTIKDVDFELPDGTSVFTISVHSAAGWADLQSQDGPLPTFLAQTSTYVFSESETQDAVDGESVSADHLFGSLPQIFGTFKAH